MDRERRIALVHDYLLVMRGAERAFETIASIWPQAPIYTLLYDADGTWHRFGARTIRTSPLQHLHLRQSGFRALLPVFPWATSKLDMEDHDLIISSSSAFAHGITVPEGSAHLCYCYTPMRYAWHERERAILSVPRAARPLMRATLDRIKQWDREAASRVTRYVAISELARERIQRFYDRDASVVHPPVETDRFEIGEPSDYLLFVGELVAHKRVDVALEAARRAERPIKIVGDGPERRRLETTYGDTAEFLGRVSDASLPRLYAEALAVVVPNVEEFGIVAVEAQAAGRPVVAYDAGGVRETVVDGTTGILLPSDEPTAFAEALADTDFDRFDPEEIKENAERFSTDSFRERFRAEVDAIDAPVPH
jgi:glycosyltransferase involved in cell wall biosynthesis